ncbi:hypothetical protein Sjap_017645 [Stephania japonica]|uniref:Uncharacterized protein n=1 Tax=Stephania japonica TaxID=461633 RepID=A0AAP0NKM5_9MAGN
MGTVNAIPLKSVEVNEVTPVKDYWSETTEELEVSPSEPYVIIAQNEKEEQDEELEVSPREPEIIIAKNEEEENEMRLEVISERPEEPQKESKEDQL